MKLDLTKYDVPISLKVEGDMAIVRYSKDKGLLYGAPLFYISIDDDGKQTEEALADMNPAQIKALIMAGLQKPLQKDQPGMETLTMAYLVKTYPGFDPQKTIFLAPDDPRHKDPTANAPDPSLYLGLYPAPAKGGASERTYFAEGSPAPVTAPAFNPPMAPPPPPVADVPVVDPATAELIKDAHEVGRMVAIEAVTDVLDELIAESPRSKARRDILTDAIAAIEKNFDKLAQEKK